MISSSVGCLSLDSYIKPQHLGNCKFNFRSCLSLDSYIKPQLKEVKAFKVDVVYLLIPTSNHNCDTCSHACVKLFISWFLHQTTTYRHEDNNRNRCLSLDSYIKPQPNEFGNDKKSVVYLLIPTSNHNTTSTITYQRALFISWFLHQTTTSKHVFFFYRRCLSLDSYIKPQLKVLSTILAQCCLSLDSYIKPQQFIKMRLK